MTLIEKIITAHAGLTEVKAGDIVWMDIDYRSARDFGGPNVVAQLESKFPDAPLADPERTFFTFDTNAPANTIGYANNQHRCRQFARRWGARLYDVDAGIGTHIAMEKGLIFPGQTAVGTDSHFNILSAVGAFGQGMGDMDIAFIFRTGRTWFEVPATLRITIDGLPSPAAAAKDLALFLMRELGTTAALGRAVEISGAAVESLDIAGRITLASMATEVGAIAFFLPPSPAVDAWYEERLQTEVVQPPIALNGKQPDLHLNVAGLEPLVSPPPSPNGARNVSDLAGRIKVDSVFVGSCTNGRWEDFRAVAEILAGRRVKGGLILKMVPATREVYERIIADGTFADLVRAGAIISQPGCGGCASGQIGMTGAGEVQLSTSNRNFPGKQGAGQTYLASPRTAAWTALRGVICNED